MANVSAVQPDAGVLEPDGGTMTLVSSSGSGWNASALERGLEGIAELALDPSFALLLTALLTATAWAVYATFYHSRLLGCVLTRLANRLYFQHHNFKIGSISVSALAGKVMFRELVYVGYDYSLRVQDGYLIFRWWRAYVPKDASEDLSHSDTRLSLVLNGVELHVYNRCDLYTRLEEVFNVEPRLGGAGAGGGAGREVIKAEVKAAAGEAGMARTWRDLIPVVKADVSTARVVLGNKLVPSALLMSAEEARLTYSTKPAASALDLRMHFVKGTADNVKVLLAPSPGYTALHDEPPRYMGEGFVVMSSSRVELYAYADEAGAVPAHPVLLRLANGDVAESAPPIAGLDLKVGKGTDFSYGPWADRQRDHLHRLFLPSDYRPLAVTPPPAPGERRRAAAFDFRLSTLNEATVDVLFSKQQETSAVHVNIGAGSYLEVTLPWTVGTEGCTTRVSGQLLHVDASTSLAYRPLVECETLEFGARAHYPRVHNRPQRWSLALTGCKATVHFVYAHIPFFADLVNDWASRDRPDLLHFVPYTWKISLLLKEFELITVSNQHNWIDCGSTNQENHHVAVCGDLLDLSFELPFVDYLPPTTCVKVWVQGEGVQASLFVPESSAARVTLHALDRAARRAGGAGRATAARWRRRCSRAQGWVDCWGVPLAALSVTYRYHPAPPTAPPLPQADITTPEKEELLLSPMRFNRSHPPRPAAAAAPPTPRAAMAPDTVSLELEVGPSELVGYGTLLQELAHLLDNIFGEDQTFTDMSRAPRTPAPAPAPGDEDTEYEPMRPLDVSVAVTLHDVRAHLPRPTADGEPPCPVVLVERIAFEMDKGLKHTWLQLVLSPALLLPDGGGGGNGHVALSALQLRGHGMHSEAGVQPHEDTVEYAWMLELTLGGVSGALSVPQLYRTVVALQTFALLLLGDEDELCEPRGLRPCHHGRPPAQCAHAAAATRPCLSAAALRYRMLRLHADPVEVWLCDAQWALRVRVHSPRVAWCNAPGAGCAAAASVMVGGVRVSLLVQPGGAGEWLRAGAVSLGALHMEVGVASEPAVNAARLRFLQLHDERDRRLHFLWGDARCGCAGGTAFFGSDRIGAGLFKGGSEPCATWRVLPPPEVGFGQSLLHAGALVFRTPPYEGGVTMAPPSPSPLLPPPPPHSGRRSARCEVPYARLVDAPAQRIDSDSKLHRASLDVPPLESSVSDSRLAGGGGTGSTGRGLRRLQGSGSRHSLHGAVPRRAASVSSEHHSESFVSADEESVHRRSAAGRRGGAGGAVSAGDGGDSGSLSSTSFVSAVSSQEDVALVHLRAQASRPIADSPLLLAGYARALPRYRRIERAGGAEDDTPPPLVERHGEGPLVYVGRRLLPRYEPTGGAVFRIVNKKEGGDSTPSAGSVRAHPFAPAWWDAVGGCGNEGGVWEDDVGVVVRVRGDVELTLTPLVLEAAQRAAEALTPVLAGVHPAAVLDALRWQCVSSVQRACPLTARAADQLSRLGADGAVEQEVSSRMRWAVSVRRVGGVLLQAGVAEDVTSLAALDDPLELAGVSVLGVRCETLSVRGAVQRRACHTVRRRPPPRPRAAPRRPPAAGIMKGARSAAVPSVPEASDTVYIETEQVMEEDAIFTLDLGSVHAQLRRLRWEAGVGAGPSGGELVITGIPPQHARAAFTLLKQHLTDDEHKRGETSENATGYIMAECGVEGCVMTAARRDPPPTAPPPDAPPTAPPDAPHSADTADAPPPPVGGEAPESARDAASSAQLDVQLVWFNFAAPPRTATATCSRLDWNLLSTASPAINAWLNPANRLGIRGVAAHRAGARRAAAVAASLMAGALESPLPPADSKHARHGAVARRLRAEPALRLLNALGRQLLAADGAALAADLALRHVPPPSVLRRALVVLARQWSALLAAPLHVVGPPPLAVSFAPDLPAPDDWPSESSRLLHHATHTDDAVDDIVTSNGGCGFSGDLYEWMASQEGGAVGGSGAGGRRQAPTIPPPPRVPRPMAASLRPARGAPRLLDAHQAFAPLLSALGVAGMETGTPPRVVVRGGVVAVRVHLAVGSLGGGGGGASGTDAGAALVLERVTLTADARQVADAAVERLVRNHDVLYISRRQLKHHFSTMVNFDLNVRFISQQVNMPLLRLLHQISSMYQSVKDAQVELRAHTTLHTRTDHHQQHAAHAARAHCSDASEFRETLVSESSLDRDTQYSTLGSSGGWEPPAPVSLQPAVPYPARPRPQSFAQKLRSTGKSVKGRLGMGGVSTSSATGGPHSEHSAYSHPHPTPTPTPTHPTQPQQLTPRCWRTVHLLLELYANMADADSVTHRFSVSGAAGGVSGAAGGVSGAGVASASDASGPRVRLVVAGTAAVQRTRLLAALSGLQLEAELTALTAAPSATVGRRGALTLTLGRAAGALLEGGGGCVLRVQLGKSQALLSHAAGRPAQALLALGAVRAELPQHPVALHGVVTRSSKQLSHTLQELGVTRRVVADPSPPPPVAASTLPVLRFQVGVAGVVVTAALLPSLQAQYRMESVSAAGETGPEARFTLELPTHSLGFATKLARGGVAAGQTEAGMPAAALVALPAVHAAGAVREEAGSAGEDGAVLRAGRYLHATADVGLFEHTLSTDLLNHLVFVQKVFMREVNEVVQKVYGGGRGSMGGGGDSGRVGGASRLLVSLVVRMRRVQLTATTPSCSAVRLEASALQLELSNRVANVPTPAPPAHAGTPTRPLFARAQLDVNLSLGQLIRNAMFEEAEPEFQQYAFFKTRISLRNAFAEELEAHVEQREVAVISLRRPLVYIQPVAVDRAVLVYLNYKTAYDYWTEQRRALAAEVRHATQQLLETVSGGGETLGGVATLLLRLDVDDVGVCLPLHEHAAVVVTLEATSVSACSMGALTCRGRFVGLCLRFATEFEASLDDWKPRLDEPALNVCCVSEGTYEVCSRTHAAKQNENAKWFLNVSWQMEGVDIHLDVTVGGLLSALGQTLTSLAGDEEVPPQHTGTGAGLGGRRDLPSALLDASLDARARSKLLEHEMSEQAKIISDLRALGASHTTVEVELRRLSELEALAFKGFRRDMLQRLRRPSQRASISSGTAPLSAPPVPSTGTDAEQRLADIIEGTSWSSVDTDDLSPGPSRSASLRGRNVGGIGGVVGGAMSGMPPVQRQSSLPAGCDAWGTASPEPEPVELRRSPPSSPPTAAAEPNVDLQLDVSVTVSSGQCVLHTKEPTQRVQPPASGRAPNVTVFLVPALQLAVHYSSRTEPPARAKRAALFAWITLQRIPEETLISPHILDFLEQTLEPLGSEPPPLVPASSGGVGGAADRLAYASFPVDVIVHCHMQPSTFRFSCLPASRVECLLRLPTLRLVFSSNRDGAGDGEADGGLSVTGCLADFSVHVFHPYGGAGTAGGVTGTGAAPRTDRKDSLSIHVEFVKFHLARSRRLLDARNNTVRFSTIVDVGAACFKYDMRRLGEILAFPRAWYRRAIVRRLFLGDPGARTQTQHANDRHKEPTSVPTACDTPHAPTHAWETLVLFAVNFTKLNVHMNMGNVMGNVSWQSSALSCSGRLSIGSSGYRNMRVGVALAGSALDARAGIVGGAITTRDLAAAAHVLSAPTADRHRPQPSHSVTLRLGALEVRGEYMGAAALMARVAALEAMARDQWPIGVTAPRAVLAHAALSWRQLQLLMSRTTTPDLLKMQLKLEEFFTQQFKSGRRVISALHPELAERASPPVNAHPHSDHTGGASGEDAAGNWMGVQRVVGGWWGAGTVGGTMELRGQHVSLACFHGNSFKAKAWALFSLKDPAISFTTEVQQPKDDGCTVRKVQSLTATLGGASTSAGGAETGGVSAAAGHQSLGVVCRMTRAALFPPQLRTLREWFHYAFSGSDIDAIDTFPSLEGALTARAGDKHVREVIFALPALQLHLRTQHEPRDSTVVVECSFITEFEDHIFVSVDAEAFLFLHDLIASYLKEKDRVVGVRGSNPAPAPGHAHTAHAHAPASPIWNDNRQYRCVTWHLEPTVRLLAWAGKSIEPYGVDYILQKLGFSHARTTIPKWVQRGALDPLDALLALALRRLLAALPPPPQADDDHPNAYTPNTNQ